MVSSLHDESTLEGRIKVATANLVNMLTKNRNNPIGIMMGSTFFETALIVLPHIQKIIQASLLIGFDYTAATDTDPVCTTRYRCHSQLDAVLGDYEKEAPLLWEIIATHDTRFPSPVQGKIKVLTTWQDRWADLWKKLNIADSGSLILPMSMVIFACQCGFIVDSFGLTDDNVYQVDLSSDTGTFIYRIYVDAYLYTTKVMEEHAE